MRHDEEMINKLRPKLQNNLRSLDMWSKQLEKDQLSLEKTFSKLTTKIDPPQSYTKYTMPIIRSNRLLPFRMKPRPSLHMIKFKNFTLLWKQHPLSSPMA